MAMSEMNPLLDMLEITGKILQLHIIKIKILEDKIVDLDTRLKGLEGMSDDEFEALERERSSWDVP